MAAKKLDPKTFNDSTYVNQFLSRFEHPFKAEMQAIREIILGVDSRITEGIKWNAPNFYYKGDMVVFTPHVTDHILMVFPNGIIIKDETGLLTGDYKDRRMAYFYDMQDIESKKAALEQTVQRWIQIMDAQSA